MPLKFFTTNYNHTANIKCGKQYIATRAEYFNGEQAFGRARRSNNIDDTTAD